MKITIKSLSGEAKGTITIPFTATIRLDIIRRVVKAIESNSRQPYGADPEAGMRHSATLSRRRHDYRGSYGHGISRVPRKIMSRRGTRMNWVAAVAPGTVGGRRAHAPKVEKDYSKKVNAKENRLAIRSAIIAALTKEMVDARGHNVPEGYPFAVESSFESLSKTKDVKDALVKLGFADELARTSVTKIRAGKGKMRGRRYVTKRGALIITEGNDLAKKVANIQGFECMPVTHLNANVLAPGGEPGRLVLFTQGALKVLAEKKLYTESRVKETVDEKTASKNTSKTKAPAKKAVAEA